jgi:predicted helicase
MGNPPYSIGQKSANDNAQNQSYPKLEGRIEHSYAERGTATNKNRVYDSYIKAFRWSTDRLDPKNGGVIAFVTNGGWLKGNSLDGFRKCLVEEFSAIYVFNLRGNARTQGETRRKEKGNVFGSGSKTPVAITLLVKKPDHTGPAEIHYHDIGDYLKREEKLAIIQKFKSATSETIPWQPITPDQHGDWLNKRNSAFDSYIPLGDKKNKSANTVFVPYYSCGTQTARDVWSYNFSAQQLSKNMGQMIDFYNEQLEVFHASDAERVEDFIDLDPQKISWTRSLRNSLQKAKTFEFDSKHISEGYYRPYCKHKLYFHDPLIELPGFSRKFFPTAKMDNFVICISGIGGTKKNTTIITNTITDLNCLDAVTQCFPLYYYEEAKDAANLFDSTEGKYVRRDGITDFILGQARERYGKRVEKEDIFYYVYGLLHSPDYRETFSNDLKKTLPRIPLVEVVKEFWAFSKAGRALAELHINYESVPPAPMVTVEGAKSSNLTVEKMRFGKTTDEATGKKVADKSTICYNSAITLSNIPAEAYDYIVNGKSAIDWIMERYQVKTDKKSGIKNDPNDWAKETDNPTYILDLLLSVINLSLQTNAIVSKLPTLQFE